MGMWNPWHGCHRKSEGCLNCYTFRGDARRGADTNNVYRTEKFHSPIDVKKNGEYKTAPGTMFFTCFSSDFLIEEADEWRQEAWEIIKSRSDCDFFFLTKRPERFLHCIPDDWENGYHNVHIGVSCENQQRADERLPIFMQLPISHKTIVLAPMLEYMDIEQYLTGPVGVVCEGESAKDARPLHYEWVLDIREQCIRRETSFTFRATGTNFVKDGKAYRINPRMTHSQARKADIDYLP